jgi:outer membrane immunogenic protein
LANPFFVDASSPVTLTSSGGRVGGYLGANLQVSPTWVLGVEGDIAWYDKTTTVAGVVGCTIFCGFRAIGTPSPNDSTAVRLTWDGSVRGRIGYLVTPDVMFYGTGGFAGQWMQETVTCGSTGLWCVANRSQTNSQSFIVGWTAGGGIEWKFGHWMVRGEYRYNEFQTQSIFFFAPTVDFIAATVKPKTQMATFGLAYKF